MDALIINLWILAGVSFMCWLLSVITKDTSWVDRIWSVVPVAYVWVFAAFGAHMQSAVLNLIAILVTAWGVRLTFNFARKGGYAPGGEDYRWPVLRARMSPLGYQLFNIFFIVIFQNVLLFLITLPAFTILNSQVSASGELSSSIGQISWQVVLLALLFVGLLIMETVADQQQWNFHQRKRAEISAQGFAKEQFLTRGLFSVSRHPNFFAEQAQWWVLFLIGATVAGSILQWTIVGAVILTALFIGSTRFTEEITISKYPSYANYQRRVSALVPWFPRKGRSTTTAAT